MKICQLLDGVLIPLTNEEKQFVNLHKDKISLMNLNERDQWLAQNLVRKGIYSISKDNQTLIKKIDENSAQ